MNNCVSWNWVPLVVVAGALAVPLEAQTVLREHSSPQLDGRFGSYVTVLGDVDGDGVDDYFVGEPYAAVAGVARRGRGWVYSGASGLVLHALTSPIALGQGEYFGSSACHAGDFDNDGVTDILVGAPGYGSSGGLVWRGAIIAFSGSDGSYIQHWLGEQMRRQYGSYLTALDDLDGDGKTEFLMSAATDEYFLPGYMQIRTGDTGAIRTHRVVLIGDVWTPVAALGDVDLDGYIDYAVQSTNQSVDVYSGRTEFLIHQFTLNQPSFVRIAPSGLGDLDGDGFPEIGVGNPFRDEVQVFSGNTGAQLHAIAGESGSFFGNSLAGAGDANGDGVADFVVGSPEWQSIGRIDMYCGMTGTWLYEIKGTDLGGPVGIGASAASLGDLNGDGLGDVLVGSSSIFMPNGGAARILGRSLSGPESVQVCVGSVHSEGHRASLVAISPSDFSVTANDLELGVIGLPTQIPTTAMVLVSNQFGLIVNPVIGGATSGGTLCIAGGGIGRFNAANEYYFGSQGAFRLEPDLSQIPWVIPPFTTAIQPGETWLWQCWYRDTGAGQGASSFSDAISIRFQ